MVAIVVASARWLSANHRAATLAGVNIIKVCPQAAITCPVMRTGKRYSDGMKLNMVKLRNADPMKFNHAAQIIWKINKSYELVLEVMRKHCQQRSIKMTLNFTGLGQPLCCLYEVKADTIGDRQEPHFKSTRQDSFIKSQLFSCFPFSCHNPCHITTK